VTLVAVVVTAPSLTMSASTARAAEAGVMPQIRIDREVGAARDLALEMGQNRLLVLSEPIARVSVADPKVADMKVITPTQLLLTARGVGSTDLTLWNKRDEPLVLALLVTRNLDALRKQLKDLFPGEQITVSAAGDLVVLSGEATDMRVPERAAEVAQLHAEKVANLMRVSGNQQVQLEVKFAEVDRSAVSQFGINLLSTGVGKTIGTTSTGQYGGFGVQRITDTFGVPASPAPNQPTPTSGSPTEVFSTTQQINDVLNLFLFNPELHLGAVIKALQQKNLLQILAEPNLIAVNGKEASFLAGGEFPFPIVQPGQGFTAVTIQFKEFGVKLKFKPVIMPNGNIHLNVTPEVSTLDFANALTISGFTVPALSTRRADTEFELQDGQSFVIAGLMDNRVTSLVNKVPGLGDIPILGNFFRSKSLQKSNAELMVLCTVRKISPNMQSPPGPSNPQPFMNKDGFDGKKPSAGK